MGKKFVPVGFVLLVIMLFLTSLLPAIAVADRQAEATPLPEPTTLGKVTVKTSPTIYLMLIGACIVGSGGILIFLRYK